MKRKPERFNYSMLLDTIGRHAIETDIMVVNPDFAVVSGGINPLFRILLNKRTPLLVDDYRLGLLLDGEVRVNINLMDHHLTAGTLVFFAPGSIVQPEEVSDRLSIMGLALFKELPFAEGRQPAIVNGALRDFQIPLDADAIGVVRQLVQSLWTVVRSRPFCRPVFDALTKALFWQYDHLYRIHVEQGARPSHDVDVFQRFIGLVNRHCRSERQLDFYASRLCLSPRYLGTLVRQTSGVTAKEWIDRAVVAEAKVMLRHSDRSAAQIADALGFPNPSFFSKYFRRLVGQTPADYRNFR